MDMKDCLEFRFSRHAIFKMFERNISMDDVKAILNEGEVIRDYPNDKPYPSKLILGYISDRPIHAVLAKDDISKTCIVITAYEPSKNLWLKDFKTKKEN